MDFLYQPSYLQYSKLIVYTLAVGLIFGLQSVHPERKFNQLLTAPNSVIIFRAIQQTLIIFSTITVFISAIKDNTISRIYLFSWLPLQFSFLFITSKWLPRFLSSCAFSGRSQQTTIIIGSPSRIHKLMPWLKRKAAYGINVIGYLYNNSKASPKHCTDLPALGSVCDLNAVLVSRHVSQVILLEIPSAEQILWFSDSCEQLGVRLLMINDLHDKLHKPLAFLEDDGVQLIAFRQEPLENPFNRLVKRFLDIAISLPVVILLLPITNLIVYFIQRNHAPGPLFFLQRRTGFCNKEFFIYKYRTMRIDSLNETLQVTVGDPRVFPGGRWLRKHSLDELPQFINVLKGEMSIVGPRPHLPEHTHRFNKAAHGFTLRSLIKPGITGLAQVEGFRGEVRELKNLTDRIRSDLFYLENWSLALEWKIIIKTARQIIHPPKSAY